MTGAVDIEEGGGEMMTEAVVIAAGAMTGAAVDIEEGGDEMMTGEADIVGGAMTGAVADTAEGAVEEGETAAGTGEVTEGGVASEEDQVTFH